MNKTYIKNIWREIRSTFNRFLAIFAIVALGVSLLVGLMQTAPNMRRSADRYYDQARLMDVRVISTLGLTEADVDAVRALDGVRGVMPQYGVDALVLNEENDTLTVSMRSLPDDRTDENENYLNRVSLLEGRMPEKPGECLAVDPGIAGLGKVGEVLTLSPENKDLGDQLGVSEVTVVGLAKLPTNFSVDTETVTAGDGVADLLLYLPESAFCGGVYTNLYLTVQGAQRFESYTDEDEYEAAVQPLLDKLEQLGEVRSKVRRAEVVEDAQAELDDARAEYEDKKAEAETSLAEAEAELADAEAQLLEAEAELQDGETQWKDGTAALRAEKRALAKTLADNQKKLADGRRQLTAGKKQLNAAKRQLEAAERQYEQALAAQQMVEDGKQQLETAKSQLELAQQAVELGEAMLPTLQRNAELLQSGADAAAKQAENAAVALEAVRTREDIVAGLALRAELDAALAQHPEYGSIEELLASPPEGMADEELAALRDKNERYTLAQQQLEAAEAQAELAALAAQQAEAAAAQARKVSDEAAAALEESKASLDENRALLAEKEQELADAEAMLEGYRELIEKAPEQIAEGKKQIAENEEKLADAEAELADGELALSLAPIQAQLGFEEAQQKLDDARAKLDDGWAEYQTGKTEYESGKRTFEKEKADAEKQLEEAEDKLIDAQRQIDEINSCEWYVLGRDTVASYVTFGANADKLEAIARVFPVFFFLVAALVALTTMTRMVDENRLQIGTLKALGYSETAITAKYLFYALAASLLGSAAGAAIGYTFFPTVIWGAYSIMYTLPRFYLGTNAVLTTAAVSAGTLCTAAATVYACHSTLTEKPASLLMPKAPQAGKRIFLEHIGPVWRRMTFTHKVTARNLFRYKKRLFMTVTGIAGCTALLLVGFGLQDSIMDLVDTQCQQLWHYDLQIGLADEAALEGRRGIEDILNDGERVQGWLPMYQKTVDISAGGGQAEMNLTVPQAADKMGEFITMRTRRGHKPVEFGPESVVISEKAAEMLGIAPGGEVVADTEFGRLRFTVTGVTENYLGGYLFVGEEAWQKAAGQRPEWNNVLAVTACDTPEKRSELAEELLGRDDVNSAAFTVDTSRVFNDTISSINSVVVVIILCAATLAGIVLYNLININIGERKKELATIKVLGFYENEVNRYIFREIYVLGGIGALAGLALGVPLHQFIIRTVEIDQMMFIRTVAPGSYLYSFGLTMLFTVLVCLLMRRHVRAISMVESMKAPE